jgi:hypothetical protein
MKIARFSMPVLCALITLLAMVACSRARSYADLTTDVQTALRADATLATAPVNVQTNNGVVVLTGNVSSEGERSTAETVARQVAGVKGVVNNLLVTAPAAEQSQSAPVTTTSPTSKPKPAPGKAAKAVAPSAAAAGTRPAPATAPPPAPEVARVTVPQGTALSVRLIDPVDTAKNKEGDTFRASLDAPVVLQDKTVIPKNADVQARLVSATSAGRLKGTSSVTLVLTTITFAGKTYELQTSEYSQKGSSRGKRSAAMIGGGAAVGAVIGAITGGGKGAAIGGAAGAGAGTGVQAMTKGQQVQLPSETLLEFQLTAPLTVVPSSGEVKHEKIG